MNTFVMMLSTPFNTAYQLARENHQTRRTTTARTLAARSFFLNLHGPNSFFKGYFYFNWEGFQDHGAANSATLTIASAKARNGDFSAWGSSTLLSQRPGEVRSTGR